MAQRHLDRLSGIDAGFLHQEGPSAHMHVGGVVVFEGAAPSLEEFIEHLDQRLDHLPRYRQKLVWSALDGGRPRWADDPAFDIRFHVRSGALPSPAGDAQLRTFVAQVAGQRLDRTRPLWECWLVECGPERFAVVFKTHHALVDGVSNFDLATLLLDLEADGAATGFGHGGGERWSPQPAPTQSELLARGARDVVGTGIGLAGRAMGAAMRPDRAVREVIEGAQSVGEFAVAALSPAPVTPLNGDIGPHRRYAVVRQELADYKSIKDSFGGTVNDVILTVMAGALRRWMLGRHEPVDGVTLRALLPLSVRSANGHGELGARMTLIRAPLPVYLGDPVASLRVVRDSMRTLKDSKQAIGAATLAGAAELAPPGVLAQASRLQFSTRLFNLVVTNIPGPQFPMFLLGRRAVDLFPLPFLAENHAFSVAIISYDGLIEYGLLGDYDALADLDVIAEGVDVMVEELLAAAAAADAVRLRRRRRAAAPTPRAKNLKRTSVREPTQRSSAAEPAPAAPPAATPDSERVEPGVEPDPLVDDHLDSPADGIPLMASTTRRRGGPAADMRAKRRHGSS